MQEYQFIITIKNDIEPPTMFSIIRKFENDYQAKNELTNIGINGLIHSSSEGEQKYYPPHRIIEIDFKQL